MIQPFKGSRKKKKRRGGKMKGIMEHHQVPLKFPVRLKLPDQSKQEGIEVDLRIHRKKRRMTSSF